MSEKYQRTQIRWVFPPPPPPPPSLSFFLSPPSLPPLSLSFSLSLLLSRRFDSTRDMQRRIYGCCNTKMERLVVILDVAAAADPYLIWQTWIHLFNVRWNDHLMNYFPLMHRYGMNTNILHSTWSRVELWSFCIKC